MDLNKSIDTEGLNLGGFGNAGAAARRIDRSLGYILLNRVTDSVNLDRQSEISDGVKNRANCAVEHLIDYFHANPQQSFTIDEICQFTGLGRRNLYYQFKEVTGMSPQKYFARVRLGHCRRELLSTDLSVTELAVKYNFFHLGSFSALYKSVYGELPSGTRKKRPPY